MGVNATTECETHLLAYETKFYTRITLLTSAHDSAMGKANQISEGRPHKGPELQSLPRMARSVRVVVKIS